MAIEEVLAAELVQQSSQQSMETSQLAGTRDKLAALEKSLDGMDEEEKPLNNVQHALSSSSDAANGLGQACKKVSKSLCLPMDSRTCDPYCCLYFRL